VRIVSLLPSATEIVCALGLGPRVVRGLEILADVVRAPDGPRRGEGVESFEST
jgi:hypothetical protein